MLRVGLTGGVGSGKSKVADMLSELGARVSRSDEIGRALMQPGQPVMKAIVDYFGPSVLTGEGTLDRARLAHIAFVDGRVEELNALVHPAVIAKQSRWMDAVIDEDREAVAVVESALIFETRYGVTRYPEVALVNEIPAAPWPARFDHIVFVAAPEPVRRQRYVARISAAGGDTAAAADDFDHRARVQWSDGRKAALSDSILQNDGTLSELRARVEALYAELKRESFDRCNEAM